MKRQTADGVELAFVDQGVGTPVVLIHGFPLDHTMWNAQIDALSRNHRVIAPDLRGFGQSGLGKGTVTMEQLADDLAAILDGRNVREPVVVCGLSMGGYVAFQFWQRHGSRLAGLILCDTRAANDSPEVAATRREMAERVQREGPAPLVEGMIPKLFAPTTPASRPELIEAVRRVMMRANPKAIAAAAYAMAQRPDMTSRLAEITFPTLVIVGSADAISTPGEMRAMAEAIPHARLAEIADCGHMAPVEKPADVSAAILEFLDELGSARVA